jgi:hypothetical protein
MKRFNSSIRRPSAPLIAPDDPDALPLAIHESAYFSARVAAAKILAAEQSRLQTLLAAPRDPSPGRAELPLRPNFGLENPRPGDPSPLPVGEAQGEGDPSPLRASAPSPGLNLSHIS